MHRLTQKDSSGNWCLKGIQWKEMYEGHPITHEMYAKLYAALWKLMEYEDSGLSPEEVEELAQIKVKKPVSIHRRIDGKEHF